DEGAAKDLKRRMDALVKEAKELQAKLDETALEFTLRAVPELVIKDSRRKANRNLGIKPKGGTTAEQDEDLRDEFLAILLSASVVSYTDRESGVTRSSLALDDARVLKQFLLQEEWAKIEGAMDE